MKPCIRGTILTIVAVSTLFSAVPAFGDTTPAASVRFAHAAPADEYFGPLGLSILGIRNTIEETSLRLDRDGTDDADTLHSVSLVEACVHDWEAKYPADSWLPGMVLALHRVYRKVGSPDGMRRSIDTASWLIARYPRTTEARTARGELMRALADASVSPTVDVATDEVELPR